MITGNPIIQKATAIYDYTDPDDTIVKGRVKGTLLWSNQTGSSDVSYVEIHMILGGIDSIIYQSDTVTDISKINPTINQPIYYFMKNEFSSVNLQTTTSVTFRTYTGSITDKILNQELTVPIIMNYDFSYIPPSLSPTQTNDATNLNITWNNNPSNPPNLNNTFCYEIAIYGNNYAEWRYFHTDINATGISIPITYINTAFPNGIAQIDVNTIDLYGLASDNPAGLPSATFTPRVPQFPPQVFTGYYILAGGDWRDVSTSERDTLITFINSLPSGSIFVGAGDYHPKGDIAGSITVNAIWCPGNHDGCDEGNHTTCGKDYKANLFSKGIQLLQGGYRAISTDWDKINSDSPIFYVQHVQFVNNCSAGHDGETDTGTYNKMESISNIFGAICGHNHAYDRVFSQPSGKMKRMYVQSGTQPSIRRCKSASGNTWAFGLWRMDTSVANQITVSWAKVDVSSTLTIPSTWDQTWVIPLTPTCSNPTFDFALS